jgi:glycerol-3-phosphate acyltransferase PlsY
MSSALGLVIACFAASTAWTVRSLAIAAAVLIFARHASNLRRLVERRGRAAANATPDESSDAARDPEARS